MKKSEKIFVVINPLYSQEIEESTKAIYVDEYGYSAFQDTFASQIKIIKDDKFYVKKFKNGDTYSSGIHVIDTAIGYDSEAEAQEALDKFYIEYAEDNSEAPAYFDTKEEAQDLLNEF